VLVEDGLGDHLQVVDAVRPLPHLLRTLVDGAGRSVADHLLLLLLLLLQ